MKIEVVRKLNEFDTLIVNELAYKNTYKEKMETVLMILKYATKEIKK